MSFVSSVPPQLNAPWTIRPYRHPHDLGGLRACFIALQDHEHEFAPHAPTGADLVDEYVEFMLEGLRERGDTILVAEPVAEPAATPGGEWIAGFVRVRVGERQEPDDTDAISGEVVEISVLPKHRGAGLGHALLAAAEQVARQRLATSLRIRVNAQNPGARRLYERFGFELAVLQLHKKLAINPT